MNRLDGHCRALIFDLDGVLFDSSSIHDKAFQIVLKGTGVRPLDYRWIAGMKTEEALKRIFWAARRPCPAALMAELTRRKREVAHRLLTCRPPVRPGCRTVLEKLHKKFRLALVSSSSRRNVNLFQRASRTGHLFSAVLSVENVSKAKPSPAIYRAVFKKLGIRGREAIVVEDAVSGIQAARRAGAVVIAMRGTSPNRDLRRAGAARLISRLSELTDETNDLRSR